MPLSEAELLAAHAAGDGAALAQAYEELANQSEAERDIDAACFFLTQAYVYALECGAPSAKGLHARLVAHGREA